MPLPASSAKLSPMIKQYIEIKQQHPDEILFYRLGDFYEMFFDDALLASRELELTLTGRDCGLPERAPMCGVPHHASETYIARLVKKGYRVAICEQVENPATAKGIVRREIVRVVTPGTVTQQSMLDENQNNYLAAVLLEEGGFGLCFADISTGFVFVTESQLGKEEIVNQLSGFEPREVVLNEAAAQDKSIVSFIEKGIGAYTKQLYTSYFELEQAKAAILERFTKEQTDKLAPMTLGFGVRALGALLKYVSDTQLEGVSRLVELKPYRCAQYMSISARCRQNLELTQTLRGGERRGSLLWVLDKTSTAMGRRMLRTYLDQPLMDCQAINLRLDSVEQLCADSVLHAQLLDELKDVFDIERLMTRVVYKSCTPRDLVALGYTAQKLASIKQRMQPLQGELLSHLRESIDPLDDLREAIAATLTDEPPALLKDGGYIQSSYSPEVDELRELLHNTKGVLAELEQRLREQTGIKKLKVGYNKVFGYYIEVSHLNAERVPDGFVRKQTLANGERYITEELKELENRILGASERLDALERELFEQLRAQIESAIRRVQMTADAVANLDVMCCFVALAAQNNYCRPQVNESDTIYIENGRHPVVERVLDGGLFVPNNTLLDNGKNLVNIITGPNMAGKSTYMRQTALIVLMAQIGCFVPASRAEIGVVDAIFTRVGASDDIFAGDSTFMVEMREVASILNNATKRSLVILDEIGRGTSTYDGMSIARAVVDYICRESGVGAKTMFATHYHELTDLVDEYDCIKNYNIAVKKRGDDIVFLRKIVPGPADDSYGIEVAKLAGLPDELIDYAKQVLKDIESQSGDAPRRAAAPDEGQQTAGARVAELLAQINIESLTPIEAMYTLNDLKNAAKQAESEGEDGQD